MTQTEREEQKKRLYELVAQSYTSNRSKWEVELFEDFMLQKEIPKLVDDLLDGGVIVPPCKVGDTVYILWPPNQDDAQIIRGEVIGFSVGMKDEVYISNINYCGCFCRPFSEVFVCREDAEQALKECATK